MLNLRYYSATKTKTKAIKTKQTFYIHLNVLKIAYYLITFTPISIFMPRVLIKKTALSNKYDKQE